MSIDAKPGWKTSVDSSGNRHWHVPDPTTPYSRVVDVFDRDPTAVEFLKENGEGGLAGGVYSMAREIDKLRAALGEIARSAPPDIAHVCRKVLEK